MKKYLVLLALFPLLAYAAFDQMNGVSVDDTWTFNGVTGGVSANGAGAVASSGDPYNPIRVWGFDSTNTVGFPESVDGATITNNPSMADGATQTLGGGTNYYVEFDDSDDYVVAGANAAYDAMSNGFTVCCWVKRDDQAVSESVISKANAAASSRDIFFYFSSAASGEFRMLVYENGGSTPYIGRAAGGIEPPAGVWVFIAGTYAGGNLASSINLYTNCIEVDDGNVNNGTFNTYHHPQAASLVGVGGDPNGGLLYDGGIDRVAMYPTALTTNELQDIMGNTHPTNRIWAY
jgi:hypothetical protein